MKMKILMSAAAGLILAAAAQTVHAQGNPPEPKSIAGKCNKEVGGTYDWTARQWVIPKHLVAAKNACVTRMTQGKG